MGQSWIRKAEPTGKALAQLKTEKRNHTEMAMEVQTLGVVKSQTPGSGGRVQHTSWGVITVAEFLPKEWRV